MTSRTGIDAPSTRLCVHWLDPVPQSALHDG